jgi:hypothetical protein
MENSGIFKTMKRQWNILITGSQLHRMENNGIFNTMKRSLSDDWIVTGWHGEQRQWYFQNNERQS